jgi:hypothetical protein
MRATNGYTDSGTYQSNPPGTFLATGRLGTAAWSHPQSASAQRPDVIGNILSGITAGGAKAGAARSSNPGPGPVFDGKGGMFNCNPCNGPIAK